jgi:O-antigen ligase
MTTAAAGRRTTLPGWAWVLLTLTVGAAAGLLGLDRSTREVSLVLVATAAALALAYAILRDVEVGVLALVALLPLQRFGRIPGAPFSLTAQEIVLALTLVSWGARLISRGRAHHPRVSSVQWGLVALPVAALWSLPFSMSPAWTAGSLARLAGLWLAVLIISDYARDERRVWRVLATITASGSVVALLALLQSRMPGLTLGLLTTQQVASGAVLVRPSVFFLDPNFLAGFLGIGTFAGLTRVVHARPLREAWPWALGALACAAGAAVTWSRSGWIGLALGVVVVAATAPPRRRLALGLAGRALALAAAPLVPATVVQRVASLGNVSSEGSLTTRYEMVGSTLQIIRDRPVFGTGLGAYRLAYPAYRRIGALPNISAPHQLPLALWAEMGPPGLLAEIAVLAGLALAWIRRRRLGWRPIDWALLAAVVALLVEALFQYYLYFEYLWVALALTGAAALQPAATPPASEPARRN